MRLIISGLLLLLLIGCVYVPKQVTQYDEECNIELKKYVLTRTDIHPTQVYIGINRCSDEACVALFLGGIVGYSLIGPVSALVSGSIVITGNTIHWLERQGQCQKQEDKLNEG